MHSGEISSVPAKTKIRRFMVDRVTLGPHIPRATLKSWAEKMACTIILDGLDNVPDKGRPKLALIMANLQCATRRSSPLKAFRWFLSGRKMKIPPPPKVFANDCWGGDNPVNSDGRFGGTLADEALKTLRGTSCCNCFAGQTKVLTKYHSILGLYI